MNRPFCFGLFFYILSLFLVSNVRAQPLLIQETKQPHALGNHLEYLEDPAQRLTVKDVLSPTYEEKFVLSTSKNVNFGFTDSVYWLRFAVQNPHSSPWEWILEISYPLLDSVKLFREKNGYSKPICLGDLRPFSERKIDNRNFLFPVQSDPGGIEHFLLRVQSTSSMNIPLALWPKDSFHEKEQREQFFLGLFFGAMLIMAVYNLFLFLSLRVGAYLQYVLFITASGLLLFSLSGMSFKYLWPDSVWLANNAIPVLIFACNIFCVSFMRSFLEVEKILPRVDILLKIHICINSVSIFLVQWYPYRLTIRIATILAVIAALLSSLVALRLVVKVRQARFYLLAWIILIFGIIVYGLKSFGFLPTIFITEYSMNLGLLAEVVLLSFGIADWIHTIRKERLEAQQKTIATKQQSYEEQKALNVAFSRFVPQKFLNLLGKKSILDVHLGDHVQKNMTILFSDIRSFTQMSEQMSPDETFRFINSYLKRMEPAVVKFNGITDKFIGDAVMGLFGRSDDAVDSGLTMLELLAAYNKDREKSGYPPLKIGIGINTGELMLGTIGGRYRMDGTVIGDAVNLASRIEGMTKIYKTPLIITEHTRLALQNPSRYVMEPLEEIQVKGKEEKVLAWRVIGHKPK